tara:strand:+ start:1203 stop:1652 length:450 start_codon:yes stop_codon:yes gene_type:complete
MDKRLVHNLIWIPMMIIGFIAIGMGLMWALHKEPWLLDKVPNEILLKKSFKELFSAEINYYLPSYLTLVYKFFGLWLTSLGLLIINYVYVTRMGTKESRFTIYLVLLITLAGIYYLVFSFIPTSPFIPVLYVLTMLYLISLIFSFKLKV